MNSHSWRAAVAERVRRGALARYVVAIGVALATVWVLADRLEPDFGSALTTPLIIPVIISAFLGLGTGLAATATAAIGAAYLTFDGRHADDVIALVRWATFVVAGVLLSLLTDRLRGARRRAEINARLQAVTLASIGDAVIATDLAGRVSMLNRQAEALTGWREHEALGLPLATVFRIADETTGSPMPAPVSEVLRTGQVVGLANHTVLHRRDGPPVPIEDSAAPIRHSDGRVEGVVLVFRDATERRRADEAVRERLAIEERFQFAMMGANDGIFDWHVTTGGMYYSPPLEGDARLHR